MSLYEDLDTHPGRNPRHVNGGYDRWAHVPVNPLLPNGPSNRVLVRARNPSRWLPHDGGRNTLGVALKTVVPDIITRQQIRRMQLLQAKAQRAEEKRVALNSRRRRIREKRLEAAKVAR